MFERSSTLNFFSNDGVWPAERLENYRFFYFTFPESPWLQPNVVQFLSVSVSSNNFPFLYFRDPAARVRNPKKSKQMLEIWNRIKNTPSQAASVERDAINVSGLWLFLRTHLTKGMPDGGLHIQTINCYFFQRCCLACRVLPTYSASVAKLQRLRNLKYFKCCKHLASCQIAFLSQFNNEKSRNGLKRSHNSSYFRIWAHLDKVAFNLLTTLWEYTAYINPSL